MLESARHYEQAFARFLRDRRVPHVCVDEARRLLLPTGDATANLKFFDYVIYGEHENLLVELKGRCLVPTRAGTAPRLECWATEDDLTSLQRWEALFGPPFAAVIALSIGATPSPRAHSLKRSLSPPAAGTPRASSTSATTPPACAPGAPAGARSI